MRIKDTQVSMGFRVYTRHTNIYGGLHGGVALEWLCTAASLVAMRFARGPVVLGFMDYVFFLRPVRLGDYVVVEARVDAAWEHSMDVTATLYVEDLDTGERVPATRAYMALVAVDEELRPRKLPERLEAVDEDEKKWMMHAAERRAQRMNLIRDRKEKVHDLSPLAPKAKHRVRATYLVEVEDTFEGGWLFAGRLLRLLDQIAGILAMRYSRRRVVTGSVDTTVFYAPARVGDALDVEAALTYVGRSSMEIGLKVIAENLATGTRKHVATSYYTMVAVDETGKPAPVPQPAPGDLDPDELLWAQARRERRLKALKQAKEELERT